MILTLALLQLEAVDVFSSGTDGYHTYRIPSVMATAQGTLLAFAEGRRNGRGDAGDIDLVLKRSSDGGRTWGPMQVVWDDGPNTCGNPCPVQDRRTGTIWLLLTHNRGDDHEKHIVEGTAKGTRTVWVAKSDDDGRTWAAPVEITSAVKRPEWSWFATGPGVGIQTRDGGLVVPCDSKAEGGKKGYAFVIRSDDGGRTWKAGGVVGDAFNECQVAELSDGALMLNMRNTDPRKRERGVAVSRDGGSTWAPPSHDPALVEPICQASLLSAGGKRLLFSNPASRTDRARMTVRLSEDDGRTWSAGLRLHEGPSAYSCLVLLPDGAAGCLYEAGTRSPYERLVFRRFDVAGLR